MTTMRLFFLTATLALGACAGNLPAQAPPCTDSSLCDPNEHMEEGPIGPDVLWGTCEQRDTSSHCFPPQPK